MLLKPEGMGGRGGGSPLNLQSNEVTEDRVANKDYSLEVRVQGY